MFHVDRIVSKFQSLYIGGDIGIFPNSRAEGGTGNFSKSREYDENMKECEEIWRKYEGNRKITLSIYEPWDLQKFWARPLIYGPGKGGGRGFGKRKDMKHVNHVIPGMD